MQRVCVCTCVHITKSDSIVTASTRYNFVCQTLWHVSAWFAIRCNRTNRIWHAMCSTMNRALFWATSSNTVQKQIKPTRGRERKFLSQNKFMNRINLNRLTTMTTWDNQKKQCKRSDTNSKNDRKRLNWKTQPESDWTFFCDYVCASAVSLVLSQSAVCSTFVISLCFAFFSHFPFFFLVWSFSIPLVHWPKILQNYTYRSCDFYKRSHVASVAYERVVLQFNIFYLS